jgi:hypothetical protein
MSHWTRTAGVALSYGTRGRITAITYATAAKGIQLTLTGVASERAQLLQFKSALLAVPGVSTVEFPASNLAASSTVPYSIKIKYVPEGAKNESS